MIDFKATRCQMVSMSDIELNDYNPNVMPKREMKLLKQCIKTYGFLFPILVYKFKDKYRIIDGAHRFVALGKLKATEAACVVLDISEPEAMQLTVLMNRIKGMHQVEAMSNLVVRLISSGLEDTEICANLGMEEEELARLKQQLGIAHSFRHHQYSKSWEVINET